MKNSEIIERESRAENRGERQMSFSFTKILLFIKLDLTHFFNPSKSTSLQVLSIDFLLLKGNKSNIKEIDNYGKYRS